MGPGRAPLHVGSTSRPREQVEVKKRLAVRVEDTRSLLDDTDVGPQVGEYIGQIFE
jgi:hypothetical protein